MSLRATLGSEPWLAAHEAELLALFPADWTEGEALSVLQIGFQMKRLGIDWRSPDDLTRALVFFERAGFVQRDGTLVRRNPNGVFQRRH